MLQAASPLLRSPSPAATKATTPETFEVQSEGDNGTQQEALLQDERSVRIIRTLRSGANVSLGMACGMRLPSMRATSVTLRSVAEEPISLLHIGHATAHPFTALGVRSASRGDC